MRKLRWAVLGLVGSVACVNLASTGCGSDQSPDIGSDDGGDAMGNPPNPPNPPPPGDDGGSFIDAINDGMRDGDALACTMTGDSCTTSADCCSGNCSAPDGGGAKTCDAPINGCTPTGSACPADPTLCCLGACVGGVCGKCVSNNGACATSADCCGGGSCVPDGKGGGICQAINCTGAGCVPTCATNGNSCTKNTDCCGGFCNGGICGNASSTCVQDGNVCTLDAQCCGGSCAKAAGATFGLCQNLGGSAVGGPCKPGGEICMPDGTCNGAGCCSRSCAPDPISGVGICQQESGCHLIGDLCSSTSECCGQVDQLGSYKGPQTACAPLTTSGQSTDVQCQKMAGQTFGVCNYAVTKCTPAGDLCKPGNATDGGAMACSTKTDCCAGNDNQCPTCQIDRNGIPRCTIRGDLNCEANGPPPAGTACASTADCCGQPCLANPGGTPPFVCSGTSCQMQGTSCSSTADCCNGLPCVIPPGGATGVCNGTLLSDGGVSDAAPPDSGTPPDGGTTLPDGGKCALYGQTCALTSDCCSGVPCVNGTCHFP